MQTKRYPPWFRRAWLTLCFAAAAAGAPAAEPWETLQHELAGTPEAAYLARLRERGFTALQAQQTLACLSAAQRAGMPLPPLASRLEEGLTKKADPPAILNAVQTRLRLLTQARDLLRAAHYDAVPATPGAELLGATGIALESGVSAEDLGTVLQRGNGQSARRLTTIVEAGESLHLAGMDRPTTLALMNDCLERDLRRMEVLRAVRYCIQQHRSGIRGDAIRRSLWGGNNATDDPRGWRGAAPSGGWHGGHPAAPGSGPAAAHGDAAGGNPQHKGGTP